MLMCACAMQLKDQENCHLEGQVYENNQSWNPDDCKQCQCQVICLWWVTVSQ